MIEMVAGVYGMTVKRNDGSTYVKGMGPESGSFSLAPDKEARLVSLGVARYVGGEPAPIPAELPAGVEGVPAYSVDSSLSELRAIAKECGVTLKVGMSKADMVAALDAHIEANTVDGVEIDTEDGEPAPTFDAAEAVQ